jgi:maltooligosyltrehalose trehalohydrolase
LQERFVRGPAAAITYSYLIEGVRRPDPASRFQPEGVHGPSQIVDPDGFRWRHEPGRSHPTTRDLRASRRTFTDRGTFAARASASLICGASV